MLRFSDCRIVGVRDVRMLGCSDCQIVGVGDARIARLLRLGDLWCSRCSDFAFYVPPPFLIFGCWMFECSFTGCRMSGFCFALVWVRGSDSVSVWPRKHIPYPV